MNKLLQIGAVLSITFFLSACDKTKVKMEVIKDCTGVYLRSNGVDHMVCNKDMLTDFESGTKIKVSFEKVGECYGLQDEVVCMMYHEYQDKIEVTKVY